MQDYMQYLPHMQELKSDILSKVLDEIQNYDETKYSAKEVQEALNATHLSIENLKALLSSAAEDFIEELAFKSAKTKQKYFEILSRFLLHFTCQIIVILNAFIAVFKKEIKSQEPSLAKMKFMKKCKLLLKQVCKKF